MTSLEPSQPWRDAIAEVLPESSGREMAAWKDSVEIASQLVRLAATRRGYVYGGTSRDPEPVRREGLLTAAEVVASDDGDVLTLHVGDTPLRMRKDSLRLNYIPHPADTADAGFLLTGVAADEATHAWDVRPRIGDPHLVLVLGEREGLLIGAARSIHLRHPMFAAQLTRVLARGIYRPGDAERLKYEAQAKQLVKADYEQAKGPRRSGAMDQTDVDTVAWALLQHGLQPTIELLREIHGSGSPSALHPKLKVFYGKLVDEYLTPLPPPAVPEPVRHIWEQLVAASRETATASLQAEVEALATARGRVEAQEAALALERNELANTLRAAAAAADSREAHIRHLETELAKVQDALTQAQHTIAGDADQLAETRTELRLAREQLAAGSAQLASRDAALITLQEQLASALVQQQETTRRFEALQAQSAEAASLSQKLASNLATLEQSSRQTIDALQARLTQSEAVLAAEQSSAAAHRQRADALQLDINTRNEEIGALRATQAQWQEDLKRATTIAESVPALQVQLTETRVELRLVTEERDRLRAADSERRTRKRDR